jgi:hypothetical protein
MRLIRRVLLERTRQRPPIKIGVIGSASTSISAVDLQRVDDRDTLPVRSTGAVGIADPDPERLVDRCLARLCKQRGEQVALA